MVLLKEAIVPMVGGEVSVLEAHSLLIRVMSSLIASLSAKIRRSVVVVMGLVVKSLGLQLTPLRRLVMVVGLTKTAPLL